MFCFIHRSYGVPNNALKLLPVIQVPSGPCCLSFGSLRLRCSTRFRCSTSCICRSLHRLASALNFKGG